MESDIRKHEDIKLKSETFSSIALVLLRDYCNGHV